MLNEKVGNFKFKHILVGTAGFMMLYAAGLFSVVAALDHSERKRCQSSHNTQQNCNHILKNSTTPSHKGL